MLKSMTGYGRGLYEDERIRIEVEAKSINHRYCDINIRLPRQLGYLEMHIRQRLRQCFQRGHFDIWVKVEWLAGGGRALRLDQELARQYLEALRAFQAEYGLEGRVDIRLIGTNPSLFEVAEAEVADEEFVAKLDQALGEACEQLERMRRAEGEHIRQEMHRLVGCIRDCLEEIEGRSLRVIQKYHQGLQARVAQLFSGVKLDETRVAQEVVLLAERADIHEEIVRLRSHLAQLEHFLDSPGPQGKKLDFLVQEINRETNTIGSKSPDAAISQKVVEIKDYLEKIREQVQNIE